MNALTIMCPFLDRVGVSVRKIIDNPASVPAPAGHYSHVAKLDFGTGSLLVLSGQVGVDESNQIVPGGMAAQAERVFEIIGAVLGAHGASFDDVVNIRSYLTNLGDLREYITVRRKYLTGEPPTSTTIEVPRLFLPEALLEVEVMAAVG
jgi:2-iminobutanoate/2-iminopropanoate deaminase